VPVLIQSPDDATAADVTKGAPVRESLAGDMAGAETGSGAALASLAPAAIVWRYQGRILISGRSSGGVQVTALADGNPFGEALVWRMAGGKLLVHWMWHGQRTGCILPCLTILIM